MSRERRKRIAFLAFVIAGAWAWAAPGLAEPRLISLDDLPPDQQKVVWERVDRFAEYAVILKDCVADSHFETRFVEAVKACVEPNTVRRVVGYYQQRAASLDRRFSRTFCSEKKFTQNNVAQKLKSTLDNLVDYGHNLCIAYLKTGAGLR
ncbi:MAG TPA: hypothetical protein VKU03_10260 [Roseiarcus sp.]|nr:hypothetical protein [Roseiarcus sp.]